MNHEPEKPHGRRPRGTNLVHPGEDQPMTRPSQPRPRPNLVERLEEAFDWYLGMVSPETGLLRHGYDPASKRFAGKGSAIRDLAAVWNLEVLSDFLGHRPDVTVILRRSLEHFSRRLVIQEGSLHFDSGRLGETAGIPHSAFMLLGLLDSGRVRLPEQEEKMAALAQGILSQQRADGSYRVYFEARQDDGLELYPGEAMLALMKAYERYPDARYLNSVEHGFDYYRKHFPLKKIRPAVQVFHANWQSQYAALLYRYTRSGQVREAVRDYTFGLHDEIVSEGFYEGMERSPRSRVTVEVACSLEGLNDAYAIAAGEQDTIRMNGYKSCIRIALAWLLEAQRLNACTTVERGGFGESLAGGNQRIDVTGHAVSGFMKSIQNGINV